MDSSVRSNADLVILGFEAAIHELRALIRDKKSLENTIANLKRSISTGCPPPADSTNPTDDHNHLLLDSLLLNDDLPISPDFENGRHYRLTLIKEATHALKEFRNSTTSAAAAATPPSASNARLLLSKLHHSCPFSSKPTANPHPTDPENPHRLTSSNLALHLRNHHRLSAASLLEDPIAAELSMVANDDGHSSNSMASGPAAICPIRFLDNHTPEEIADYFKKHKRHLPRSHQVCVHSVTQDVDAVRQFDQKFGDFANMIQWLGQKHKPLLPRIPLESEISSSINSTTPHADSTREWALSVAAHQHFLPIDTDHPPPPCSTTTDSCENDHRTSHFDRPLRDIRLGESPTRPWGLPAHYSSPTTTSPPLPPTATRSRDSSPE